MTAIRKPTRACSVRSRRRACLARRQHPARCRRVRLREWPARRGRDVLHRGRGASRAAASATTKSLPGKARFRIPGGGAPCCGPKSSASSGESTSARRGLPRSGNKSVAAEMFEKAGDFRRAGDCYAQTDFARHAAKAYVKCNEWKKAAECLDQVILEESTGAAASDPARQAETRKLVRMAGDLYGRAGLHSKAQAVFERGGLWIPAAELALAHGSKEQAVALFQKGGDPKRAAEVLKGLGKGADALRMLGEHHRDKGDDAEAARCFEEAASTSRRATPTMPKVRTGGRFRRRPASSLAAEMFKSWRSRAGQNYERMLCTPMCLRTQSLSARRICCAPARSSRRPRSSWRTGPKMRSRCSRKSFRAPISRGPRCSARSSAARQLARDRPRTRSEAGRHAVTWGVLFARDGVRRIRRPGSFEKMRRSSLLDHLPRTSRARGRATVAARKQAAAQTARSPASQKQAYKIVGKFGRGGMGVAHVAQDSVLTTWRSRCCPRPSWRNRRRSRTSCAWPRAPRSSTTRTS